MLNLILNNGRSIRATELHVSYTYAGLIQGPPNEELNSEILDDIIPSMQRLFPDQPVHNLPPTIKIKKIARQPDGLHEAPVLPRKTKNQEPRTSYNLKLKLKHMPKKNRVLNDADSTNGICDQCETPLEECECEDIICQSCEDGQARRHQCASPATHCEHCDHPIDDCDCKPSYLD